jgi:hypothetical protein
VHPRLLDHAIHSTSPAVSGAHRRRDDRHPNLRTLHHRWWTAVYAQLDRVLEDPPEDLVPAVRAVWGDLAGRQPGLWAFLDAYAGRPALASVERRQCERLRADLGVELDVPLAASQARPAPERRRRWRLVPDVA